jgi:hypothetical protein
MNRDVIGGSTTATIPRARQHAKAMEMVHEWNQDHNRLLPEAKVQVLADYIIDTACDPKRVCAPNCEFDSLELAWIAFVMNNPVYESEAKAEAEDEKLPEEYRPFLKPDQFATTFETVEIFEQSERRVVGELLKQDEPRKLHEAAHLFIQFRTLGKILGQALFSEHADTLEGDDKYRLQCELLHKHLKEKEVPKTQGDSLYDTSMALLHASFGSIGVRGRYMRAHPSTAGTFVPLTKILEWDLTGDEVAHMKPQTEMVHYEADQWRQMDSRVREQWLLMLFMYRFDQEVANLNPNITTRLPFRDTYLVHWGELGSVEAMVKLKRTTNMHMKARPVLVHLGDKAWVVYDRAENTVRCRTQSVVKALVEWMAVVVLEYGGKLENGAWMPKLGGVAFVVPEPMDIDV